MSDRPSGNPSYRTHARGLPVVGAPPAVASAPQDASAPEFEVQAGPSVVSEAGAVEVITLAPVLNLRHSVPMATGWSPTAWRLGRSRRVAS